MSDFRSYRMDNFPPIVKNLVIINVLVWLAQITLGITEKLMLYPIVPEGLREFLVRNKVWGFSEGFEPYQIATHMFAHSPGMFFHLLFNMFALWMFGRILESFWGGKRFLLFYLLCGVGAAALHLIMQSIRAEQVWQDVMANSATGQEIIGAASPALGASGAVMGIFVAFAFLFPNTELYLMFIPIPIKAKWAVLGLAAIDLFGGFAGISGDNIAHFAHLGGALTGFILVMIWNRNRKRFY